MIKSMRKTTLNFTNGKLFITKNILFLNRKRSFSATKSLRLDEDNILDRIDKLIQKNKENTESLKNYSIASIKPTELENKQVKLDHIIRSRVIRLKLSIQQAQQAANVNEEENEKIIKNNSQLTKIQVLLKDRLTELEESDSLNKAELYKLQNNYNKVVVSNLEKAEAIVEAPV